MSDDIIRKLKNLAGSRLSKAFFEILSRRTNDANSTKVDRMLTLLRNEGLEPGRQEVVEIMKELGQIGVGRFLVGRHGKPSRFEWWASALEVAGAALGSVQTLDIHSPAEGADEEVVEEEESNDDAVLDHRFHLRPNFAVVIKLPVDFSDREAERLAAFVQTLPIRQEATGEA